MLDFSNIHFVDEDRLKLYDEEIKNYISSKFLNKVSDSLNGTIYSQSILPEINATYDLGSSIYYWNNIYGKTIYQNGSQVALKSEAESAQTTANTANALANELDSLQMPTGEILWLSAKGCTTASIAQANGVIDVSGQNNHGTASSGIQIINDEQGIGYNFNSSSQIISLNSIVSIMQTAFQYSFLIKFKLLSKYNDMRLVNCIFATANSSLIFRIYDNRFELMAKPRDADNWVYNRSSFAPVLNNVYTVVGTIDFTNGISKLYIGGELINQIAIPTSETIDTISRFTLNREYYSGGFNIYDFRIYPYLLSATQVKALSKYGQQGQDTTSIVRINEINLMTTASVDALFNLTSATNALESVQIMDSDDITDVLHDR